MKTAFVFLLFMFCIGAYAQDMQAYYKLDSLSKLYDNRDVQKSYDYQKQAIEQALLLKDSAILMQANARMAHVLYLQGNFQAALNHWDITIPYARNTYDTIQIYRGKGVAYDRMGNPDLALDNFLKSLDLVGENQLDLRVDILNDLGLLYRRIDEPERALKYFNETNKLKAADSSYYKAYMNTGLIYLDLDQYDSAIYYFNLGYQRVDKSNLRPVSIYLNNMGAALSDMGKPKEALPYAEKAIEVKKKLGIKNSLANSYNLLSWIYLNLKDYPNAEKYASLSLDIQDTSSINNIRYNALRYLIEARVKQEDTTQLMDLIYQTMEVRNVTYSQEKTAAFTEMATKYDLREKENELLQKNLDLQKAESEIEKQALLRKALTGVLLLSLIIIILIFFSQRRKVKDNKLLKLKNEEIELRNKQIRQMQEYKSRFFANISHEFRTPLTLILAPLEEIKQKVSDRQSLLYLNMMQKNAHRLLNQVNQLLDLSKLDAGQLKLHVVEEDIIGFVKGVTMCFESLALSRNIHLVFCSDQQVCNTWFDKDCIEKIMVNLLSNAFKFTTESDQIAVEITRKKEDQIEIKVSDTGRGIDIDEQGLIFERYYHTESDMQASSGIGLALVKELVESHHGSVEVWSAKGEGSTFIFTLPLGKDQWKDERVFEPNTHGQSKYALPIEPESDYSISIDEDNVSASGNTKTVLVIEDNADVRLFIKESLKDKFQVIEAENGKVGIEKGETFIPDVIITDIMMHGMDGYDVVEYLKHNEKTSHIPIIMLTARADHESKLKGLATEADNFMTKPFERKELIARITNLIHNREKLKAQFGNTLNFKPGDIQVSSVDQTFLEKLLTSVEENIDNSAFSVEDLANIVGMSRSQLHRKLQAIIGQPPNKFIRNIRLARAMELLKNNAGSVAEVAYMTGFTSPNYFSKCFNDLYGFSPGEVKKSVL